MIWMVFVIFLCLFLAGIFLLICISRCRTDYDRKQEDMEQEEFLKDWLSR